jgi:hypothetical protein
LGSRIGWVNLVIDSSHWLWECTGIVKNIRACNWIEWDRSLGLAMAVELLLDRRLDLAFGVEGDRNGLTKMGSGIANCELVIGL